MISPRQRLENRTRDVLKALDSLADLAETSPDQKDIDAVAAAVLEKCNQTFEALRSGAPTKFKL